MIADALRDAAVEVMRETRPEHLEVVGDALKRFCALAAPLTSPPAPSGCDLVSKWRKRADDLFTKAREYPEGDRERMRLNTIAGVMQACAAELEMAPSGRQQRIEEAFREGYDFGQADAGFDEVDASGARSKSGTRQHAKDAIADAVHAELEPLKDALIDIGHTLAKGLPTDACDDLCMLPAPEEQR